MVNEFDIKKNVPGTDAHKVTHPVQHATDGKHGGIVSDVKEHIPGTTEHKLKNPTDHAGTHHNPGHNLQGAAGAVTGGAVGSTVDTHNEKLTEKITKHVPGTEANKVHKANVQQGTN